MATIKKSLYEWCVENNIEHVLDEWDYEKNSDLTPHSVGYGSGRKAFWKCRLGHSWEGEIKGRSTKGRNCPVCSNDKVLVGYNDFETWCEQHNATRLLDEWDYNKNEITPRDVVFGYRKPVWWQCANGHSFQKNIRYRLGLTGEVRDCPHCRGIRVVSGDKSLGTIAPHLLEEWDYEKNSNLPSDYTYGSCATVWWKCKTCGHSWKARINHRANGVGCPPCSSKLSGTKQMIPEEGNSFLDLFPDLCQEWHPTKNGDFSPADFKPGSNKQVWWSCVTCGTEWKAPIVRRSQGKGCPACMKKHAVETFIQSVIDKQGALTDNFPSLVEEWDFDKNIGFDPSHISCGSEEKVWWKCKTCGHSWKTTIAKRTKRKQGCPECRKELRTSFPEKAIYFYVHQLFDDAIENYRPEWLGKAEIDIYIPSLNIGIEYDGIAFHQNTEKDLRKNELCKNAHVQLLRIREPKCSSLNSSSIDFILPSYKQQDLEVAINRVLEWLIAFIPVSNIPLVDMDKDKGDIYELMNLQAQKNSLEACFPELLKEWHPTKNKPLTPAKVKSKSNKKVWWVCSSCGHEWQTTVSSRSNGRSCPLCAQDMREKSLAKYAVITKGSLLDKNPLKASEWHPTKNGDLTPANVSEHSNKKVWWLCAEHGHEWQVSINQKNGCPYCNNRKVLEGFNDLSTTRPDLAAEWHPNKNDDLTPTMVHQGSHTKAWWLCSVCGHEWETAIKNRNRGSGCPKCGMKKAVQTRQEKQEAQ